MLKMHNVTYSAVTHEGEVKSILHSINLSISPGEFVGIVGGNGAGKSTLLKLVKSSIQPSSGAITRNYGSDDVACVIQDYKLSTFDKLTIRENLHVALHTKSPTSLKFFPDADEQFQYWLSKLNLGLERKMDDWLSALSGGQRQAVSIVMSIIRRPKLLLLDEHTSALDPVTAQHLMQLSYQLAKENNITTLMVTHNLQHASQYSDRVVVMKAGSVAHDLTTVPTPDALFILLENSRLQHGELL